MKGNIIEYVEKFIVHFQFEGLKYVRFCVLHAFLNRSSISEILQHISFLLVNLGFTMTIKLHSIKKMAKPFHTINIRSGTMFCGGKLFRKKCLLSIFNAHCIGSILTKMANLL